MVSEDGMPTNNSDANAVQNLSHSPQPDSGLTLVDLINRVRKHLVTAIVTFVLVVLAMCAYLVIATPQYTATSQLYVTANAQAASTDTSVNSLNTMGSYIAGQIKSYPTLATTESVLQPVIDQMGLKNTVIGLAKSIVVTNPTNTAFVEIAVTDPNPQQAANIANAVAQSLSNVVSGQLGQSNTSQTLIKLSLVQQATVPNSPSNPNLRLTLIVAAALGIVAGILLALLKDMMATRVQESTDLTEIVDAPIMGRIPTDESLNQIRPVVVSNPDGPIAEEFRRIRTNLSFIAPVEDTASRLFVITSTAPHEGKTTMAANIAAALAENGASVLVIDADLRHPSIAQELGLEGNVGLAHVLSGQLKVKDVIQRYWKPNLHIMPAGPRLTNASVLLNSMIMKSLISQALRQYEYVIVDTTPLTVANDAAVFGKIAGGVVLVSGRNITLKHDLRDTVGSLRNLDVPVIGFVFNYARERKRSHNDYYSYYYDNGNNGQKHSRRGKKADQKLPAPRRASNQSGSSEGD